MIKHSAFCPFKVDCSGVKVNAMALTKKKSVLLCTQIDQFLSLLKIAHKDRSIKWNYGDVARVIAVQSLQ